MVVLYSGGRDSTCLLDLAVTVAGRELVTALHVNYGLRAAADQDERHCRLTAGELGVQLAVHRPASAPRSGNLQAWARAQRYTAADRLARGGDVAAGHTATDQVETILYRLASSPSRRALLGMRPREKRLIRPLLGFTRAQTAAHCQARGLAWREDETNASDAYARNRIRHALVPALEQAHPAAQANVLALAEMLAGEAEVLDELVDVGARRSRRGFALSVLRAQPRALQRLIVQRLADAAVGEPGGRRRRGVPRRSRRCPRRARHRSTFRTACGPPPAGASCASTRTPPLRTIDSECVTDDPAIGEILVGAEDLNRRVKELADQISSDYADKDLLLIGVLKGAVFFVSDLMRHLEIPVEVDFMAVASYGSATRSSGVVRILKDLDAAIEGRDVLIVEDIVDSGLTLQYLLRNLAGRNPRSLEVCALLIKPERREVDLQTRYVGFEIPDRFAIGYGLDHAERYRNLPYVAALAQ